MCECLRKSKPQVEKWRHERMPSVKKSNLTSHWMKCEHNVWEHCFPVLLWLVCSLLNIFPFLLLCFLSLSVFLSLSLSLCLFLYFSFWQLNWDPEPFIFCSSFQLYFRTWQGWFHLQHLDEIFHRSLIQILAVDVCWFQVDSWKYQFYSKDLTWLKPKSPVAVKSGSNA